MAADQHEQADVGPTDRVVVWQLLKEQGWSDGRIRDVLAPEPSHALISMPLPDGTTAMIENGSSISLSAPNWSPVWHFQARIEPVDGQPRLVELAIRPREGLPQDAKVPITARNLRAVPLQRFLQGAWQARHPQRWADQAAQATPAPGSRIWPLEHYYIVAQISLRAEAQGNPPRKAIMEHWNVKQATASRWRRRARELGYLPKHDPSATKARSHPDPHHASAVMIEEMERQVLRKVINNLDNYPGEITQELENRIFVNVLIETALNAEHPLRPEALALMKGITKGAAPTSG